MPNTIQPGEYSMGGGTDGAPHIPQPDERQPVRPVLVLERGSLAVELQLAQQ